MIDCNVVCASCISSHRNIVLDLRLILGIFVGLLFCDC